MNHKVLFIDDDTRVLDRFSKQLRQEFDIITTRKGELSAMRPQGHFAVVVTYQGISGKEQTQFPPHDENIFSDCVHILIAKKAS